MAKHRDALARRFVAVADRAVADQSALDRIMQVGQLRLDIFRAGREEDAARPDLDFRAVSEVAVGFEKACCLPQRGHRAGFRTPVIAREVLALAGQQILAGNAIGETGKVVAARDPGRPAFPGIDKAEIPLEARKIQRGGEPGRPAADDEAI